jgi:hypothetical protein
MDLIVGPLIVGVVIGVFVWLLGQRTAERREKNEAIRDLMTYRGDYSSDKFRQALNRVSITFHGDEGTRKQVRELNEMVSGDSRTAAINRKIVGLIYDLCRKNKFAGITEYDIDQSFPEQKQTPVGRDVPQDYPIAPASAQTSADLADRSADDPKRTFVEPEAVVHSPKKKPGGQPTEG